MGLFETIADIVTLPLDIAVAIVDDVGEAVDEIFE